MNYENPEKRIAIMEKEILDTNSEIYLENLLDLAVSVVYDIHTSGTWKNSKPIKCFLDRYSNFSDRIYKSRVSANDFECLKIIGQGGFGRVDLVKHKQTKNIYAMKIIEKSTYIQNAFNGFWEERDILAKNVSDWLVKCFYAFMDLKKLYIVMEYMPGGNLYHWLMTLEEFNEEQTHFYAMQMLLAVETLHKMGFLHRDLKPDNMLLDKNGHLKLADFGTCIRVNKGKVKTNFQVGTPDYIAPEVLRNAGTHDLEVGFEIDWWAFGIVIFELFYGETPFEGESTATLYKNIMCYKKTLIYPDDKIASPHFINFLQNILTEPNERINIDMIKIHPYVANAMYSWNLDNIRQHQSPLMIEVSGEADTQYITYDANEKRNDIAGAFTNNNFFSGENLAFTGFTFNRSHQYGIGASVNKSEPLDSSVFLELQEKLTEIELSKQQLAIKLEKHMCEYNQIQSKLSKAEKDLVEKEQIIIVKKNEQIQSLEANKQLKVKLESLALQYETSQKEIDQLNLKISEKDGLIKNVKIEILNATENISSLKKNLQNTEQRLADIHQESEERAYQIDSLSKIESLLEDEKNINKDLSNDLNMKNRKIIEYEKQLKIMDDTIMELNSQNKKHNSTKMNNSKTNEELDGIRVMYDKLQREKLALDSKVGLLTDDLKEIQGDRDLLRSELRTEILKKTALEKTRDKLNKELTERKSQFNILQNKAYETEDQMRLLKQRVNVIESEKDQLELACGMFEKIAGVKDMDIKEAQAEFNEMKEEYEKKVDELENEKKNLQKQSDFITLEFDKLNIECKNQKSLLDKTDSLARQVDFFKEHIEKLKGDIAEKKEEIVKLLDNNENYEIEVKRLNEQIINDQLRIKSLVDKIDVLINNPEALQLVLPRKKKDVVNKQTGKRIKELELELSNSRNNMNEKMHELSEVKNECQSWRDKFRELEQEVDKKNNVIKHLLSKMGDTIGHDSEFQEDIAKEKIMSTQLEGRIEVLKKGKGRHKITWTPSFAVLQPFKMDIYQNASDQVPLQTIELREVMHVKEATQADFVHIEKNLLPQMLQIIYNKSELEDSRRSSVMPSDFSRRSKAATLSTEDSNMSMRSSCQDVSGVVHIENHSFVPMRFRSSQICEICHLSCSDFINPPPAFECIKCKKRIHAEHINSKILSCQGAIEMMSIKLENNEARVAWLQRFLQLKQYQKSEEVPIGPNTFFKSIRNHNQRLSPSNPTIIH